ncbi:hypothetical protein A3D78_06265 [Candidatus Gottesmanbacteria bacterium RIFCSPHIGHO2_02_FULL_39_14]|uniref:DUF5678 domain-containing protein n=2 Tax=Candidatus Gottesmaniibacteriota TaxID=1752720 RepID=A0A1F5ZYS2_9BACT|nr:MAG: hypothetical protein A2153_00955 [Candidatus Gottesmanbacteria bacterium RBG_16_38_7b]OGG17312.1 MAG: hypothetical protein A3D78_06265 [Candidatus Gottesmanbacteria bacterium RIFCSPHIGHO2_02_FULL_39_14]
MKRENQEKIISLLLSGKHPKAKQFAGRHVAVVNKEVLPLKEGEDAVIQIDKLEKKYGKTPIIIFVPRQDISYILILCPK